MAGSCRRLLATFSLIFAAPMLLRGQDAADRSSERAPVIAPKPSSPSYSVPLAPVRIPLSPNLSPRYPEAPGTGIFQQLVFQQMVRAAGIIFSGRVTFIGHDASSSRPDPSSTTVTFRVEHAIRGTSTGQNLTIHEWAGLWTSGERYRVGEHVLLFLYSPGKLGLTSPVAGAMGRFAMDSQGQILMSALHVANLAADPILGGKTVVPYAEFVLAVRRSSGEE
ncbi:MAG: hypothetical protein WB799_17095 [Candidatus Sulfotelmatobacter sp.]